MNKTFSLVPPLYSTALVAIVLLGCAAEPNKSRQTENGPPAIIYASEKPSNNIAECIFDKWQHLPYIGPIMSKVTAQGYTIIQNGSGGIGADPAFICEIDDGPTGTEVKFYVYSSIGDSASYFEDAVKECQ